MFDFEFWVLFGCASLVNLASGGRRGGQPGLNTSLNLSQRHSAALGNRLRESSTIQALCLAMAVLGPLTMSKVLNRATRDSRQTGWEAYNTPSGCTSTTNTEVNTMVTECTHGHNVFSTVEWGMIKGLLSLLGRVDECLEWLGANNRVQTGDQADLKAGIEMLQKLKNEHTLLETDVSNLKKELKAARDTCVTLSRENAKLKRKAVAAVEHERIIEQDRVQISALLDDKSRLQEENAALEREIAATQELLRFAEERNQLEETIEQDEDLDDDRLCDDNLLDLVERCIEGETEQDVSVGACL